MQLANIISVDGVRAIVATSGKKRLFQDLGELAQAVYGLPSADVVEALTEREALGPTGVGHGVALPHARVPQLDRVRGLFIRLERPLDFDSVDRQPVDLIFCLLAPATAGVEHLKALASVSRTMRDAGVLVKLRANSDPAKLHAVLTAGPASQAA